MGKKFNVWFQPPNEQGILKAGIGKYVKVNTTTHNFGLDNLVDMHKYCNERANLLLNCDDCDDIKVVDEDVVGVLSAKDVKADLMLHLNNK